jgi:hypothetical protein
MDSMKRPRFLPLLAAALFAGALPVGMMTSGAGIVRLMISCWAIVHRLVVIQ